MHKKLCHLSLSLLDEVTAFLEVREEIGVGVIQNTDSLIDEQVREDILHPKGHIQDVRHLRRITFHYHYTDIHKMKLIYDYTVRETGTET